MKKRITFNLLISFLLFLFAAQFSFAQDGKDYDTKKASFWNLYLQYKENLKLNPFTPKPIDPSGLFKVDENNNFSDIGQPVQAQGTELNGPWIVPQPNTAASYIWSQATGTYTPIVGTVLGTASNDDNTFINIPLGFTFGYDGLNYSTIDVNTNGYIKFGTISGSNYPNILSLQTNIFAAFNNDMRGNNTTSSLQYLTTGSVGSRTFTFQWSNYGFYNAGWDTSDISYQIILSETSNTIKVVYGNFATIKVPTYATSQAGINTTLADFNNRTTATDWSATTAGGINTAGCTITAAIKPALGLTYTWTPLPMTYSSSNTIQLLSGTPVYPGFNNNQIAQIQVVSTGGSGNFFTITGFSLGTNGSTSPATDITNAKLYYTGTSGTFATTNLYGTSAGPNGTFTINGNQVLPVGTSYFWLTYDVPISATPGNLLDAQCNSITGSGAMGTVVPTVIAPAGNRPINAVPPPLCGVKNIPGDYPSLTACFFDLNISGITCPTIINVAPGYTETNVNLTLTCPTNAPNATNTLTIRKNGAGVNPLLTAGTGTSLTTDGIIILNGVRYVTFDGIDLQENVANTDATMQMEWGYALVKQSGTLACQNNTIQNCTVTLNKSNVNSACIYTGNHTATSTTALTVTNLNGTGSYNKFYSNTLQNSFMGMNIQGYSAVSPFDFYDQGNEVSTTGSRRNQILNFGNGTSASSAYGIRAFNQNRLKISNTYINSTGGANNNSTLNGIFLSTATNANVDIFNDTITVVSGATTSQLVGIACDMGATGLGNTINIYNNVVTNCTYPSATSGEFRGIATGNSSTANSTASYTNIYNNKVTNNIVPGTGQFSCYYLAASLIGNMIQVNFYGNEATGNSKPTGASGQFNMVYCSSAIQTINVYNNTLSNNTSSSATIMYGYFNNSTGSQTENIYNNTISNNTNGGDLIALNVTEGLSTTLKNIYGNTISGSIGGGTVGGIISNFGFTSSVYNNNIFNLQSNSAAALAPAVYGIATGTSSPNTTIYNNFISELKTPNATGINSIYGMWLQGVATSNHYVYYNSIYLNASSTSATFGSSGIAFLNVNTTAALDMRNNVVVNNSTPGASGRTTAFQKNTTVLTNYLTVSGNNCFYAGTPSATNLVYFDGTNADQTIQAMKNRVTPREQASFTELPPFVNVSSSPYNLHMQTGVPTQVDQGGQPLAGYTTDYDGNTRNATFPDAGADEFAGTMVDNASPLIVYNNISNGGTASPRVLTSFALVTDPSGVNTTAGTKPRIYYKKSTNANTFNDNTSGTDGWKFVEASNSVSPFDFSVNYTLIFGGSVVAGDIIQYFVTAQDLNGTPRIGINAGAYATQPTSVNLAAANFPLASTINQYTITANTYTSTINVGSTETITSLTNAGGLFQLLNTGSLSGNLLVNITSDLTVEAGTFALNQLSETGPGGYTVTIQSSAPTLRTISGTTASALVRLDGAKRVTIDGRSGGSGTFLLFRNSNTANPVVSFVNDAQNCVLRNCIIEGANTSTVSGLVLLGTTTVINGQGNDNNTITYNELRPVTALNYTNGIYCAGTVTTPNLYNNNCTISNNNVHDFFIDGGLTSAGISIVTGNTGFNIDSNSIYHTTTKTMTVTGATPSGINISSTSNIAIYGNFNIRRNYVGGSAPLCGGTAMIYTVSSTTQAVAFRGFTLITGMIPNFVNDNVVANIDITSNCLAANNFMFLGIGTGQGIWNIKRNTIGSGTGNDNIKITLNGAGAGLNILRGICLQNFTSVLWGGVIDSNTIGSWTIGGTASIAGGYFEGLSIQGTVGLQNNASVSYNTVGSTTTPNSIRFTYATGATNLRPFSCFASANNITITGNTFQNITDQSTGASALFGMLGNGATGTPVHLITNNLWADISTASTAALGSLEIIYSGSTSNNGLIAGNTVRNITLSNTGAFNSGLIGIFTTGNNASGGTITKNRVYNMTSLQTGAAPNMFGAFLNTGADWTLSNNMFALTNGEPLDDREAGNDKDNHVDVPYVDYAVYDILPGFEVPANYNAGNEKQEEAKDYVAPFETPVINDPKLNSSSTNSMGLYGIYDATNGGTKKVYYNTIYIGGSQTGSTNNSFCFAKAGAGDVSLRNNLFYNNRTGAGNHYAIGNLAAVPLTGWGANFSNYNVFVTPDSTLIGEWGLGVPQSLSQWRTTSSGDNMTWYAKNTQVTAASLFTNISTGDLHITSTNAAAWLVSGKGLALSTEGTDFDGNARSTSIGGGVTDVGADEFTVTPPGNPVALQSGPPTSGGATDYTLYGRKICTINWGTGGTYPTSMAVNYFSGVSPLAPNVTNPNRSSNSYWTAVPTGTFSGTTYDITWFFGDNETYTVTSPTTNVLLAKNDNTFWMTYPQGAGTYQSEFNPSLNSVKVRGLLRFSSFTLSDAALPAEFPRTPLNNSIVASSSATLVWSKSSIAVTYRAQLATDSLFNTIVVNDSTLTDTTKLVSGLVNGQNYWWRVNGKNGTGTGGWSQVFKFTCQTVLPPAIVNLTVIPGGFYNTGNGMLNMRDTIRVYLVDSTNCLIVDSARGVLDSVNFGASISFSNANSGNYYMLVYHRNHLGVGTRFKAAVTRGATVGYDFTTDSAKCFGFNMIKVSNSPVRWGMIPGDANIDGFVDGLDQTIWIGQNGLDGYLSADFNGDSFIDGLDQTIWIIYNGNSSFQPCGFTFDPIANVIIKNTSDYDAKKSHKMTFDRMKKETPVENNTKQNNNRK